MAAFKHSAVSFGMPDMPTLDAGSSIGSISLHNAIGGANLEGIEGPSSEEVEREAKSLEGATMSDGQEYEDSPKSKSGEE
jgi:hypothetical protein